MSAQPPRLLIVTTVYNMIRDFLLPYAEHYREKGWRVDALAQPDSTFGECEPAFDHAWTIEWSRNPLQLRNPFGHLRQMRELVARERYDIVHFHTPIAGFLGRLRCVARDPGTGRSSSTPRTAFTSIQPGRLANAPFSLAEKAAARWTDYLVVINEEDARAARRLSLVPPDRLVQMPGIGIDTSRFQPDRVSAADIAAVRSELGLEPQDQLVLVVAEFTFNKRHEDAVRAFAQLGDTRAHLALAGQGGACARGHETIWSPSSGSVPGCIGSASATTSRRSSAPRTSRCSCPHARACHSACSSR